MPLIVGNRIKPNIVVPKGQKGAKNPLVSEYVRMYVCTPLRFATISLKATKFET